MFFSFSFPKLPLPDCPLGWWWWRTWVFLCNAVGRGRYLLFPAPPPQEPSSGGRTGELITHHVLSGVCMHGIWCMIQSCSRSTLIVQGATFWGHIVSDTNATKSYLDLKMQFLTHSFSTLFLCFTDCWFGQWRHTSALCGLWTRTQIYVKGP